MFFLPRRFSPSSISSRDFGFRIVVRNTLCCLAGLGVLDSSLVLWKRCVRPPRRGGGGGGCNDEDNDLDGEAAREDARDEATIAFGRESTATEDWTEALDGDVKRRFWVARAARKEGLYSEADTKESSEEASSSSWTLGGFCIT